MKKTLRLGMVGGGEGAFIGSVHRMAARLDGAWDLVAGCLSSTPEKAARSATALGLERSYASFAEMAVTEAAREDGIDAVSIVTPNHMHIPVSRAFLKAGIHVICDKPLSSDLAEAVAFEEECKSYKALFFLTHNYTANAMVRQARDMVLAGQLGEIRLVHVAYLQDWLAMPVDPDHKQAQWRTDAELTGGGGAMADIGTHAANLSNFIMAVAPKSLAADLSSFVEGRAVNDNGQVLLRYANGARGTLLASQVATGMENGLTIRIHGTKAGLRWAQESPNELFYTPLNGVEQRITRGGSGANAAANAVTRVPAGHPEGYLEAFSTLYREIAEALTTENAANLVPNLGDGVWGMRFVDACLKSSAADAAWTEI